MRDLSRVLAELQSRRVEALADVRRLEAAIAALGAPARPRRGGGAASPGRGRRRFTAAQKKAVSDRMKKYWAQRRKQTKRG